MKKIFLILTTVSILAVSFQSCKKDKPLTPEEAKIKIDNADQDLSSMVNSLKNGSAVTTLNKFIEFSKSKIAKKSGNNAWVDDMFTKLEDVIDFEQLENELDNDKRFYFDHYLGNYSWNNMTKTWSKTASNNIQIAFPSEENMTSNDILFTFSSYTDEFITVDGESFWAPTSLHAKIEQNGTKLIGFDVNEIDFDSELFYLYKKVDVSVYVNPLTANYLFENRTTTNFYSSYDLSDGTNTIGINANLNTLKELTEDFDEQDLKDISGKIFVNNLEFRYAVNIEHIADYPDYSTDAQINSDVNVDVYVENEKIGYLFLENENVYIVYNDGSRELVEDAFSQLIQEIEDFSNDYAKNNKSTLNKQKRKILKFIIFKTGGFKNLKRAIKYEHKVLSKK